MALVNASSWPPTQAITMSSKATLIQELLYYEEVIGKRVSQIADLRKGLEHVGLVTLITRH